MDPLTARAEQAALGSMIDSPQQRAALRFLKPGDFQGRWHRRVYQAISAAADGLPLTRDGWRDAILRADPQLTGSDLDDLVNRCPVPDHASAYGTIVVTAWAQRRLAELGETMTERARVLAGDAAVLAKADPRQRGAYSLAVHLDRVAAAIEAHTLPPHALPDAVPGERPGSPATSPGQARREETALAGLMRQPPELAREITRVLPAEAITDPHRRRVYRVLRSMVRAGRPVDELTLDWELATRDHPLHPPDGAGGTHGQRLAGIRAGHDEALAAARELQGQHERAIRPRLAGPGQATAPETPSAGPAPGPASSSGRRPPLKLLKSPGSEQRGHGPQAR
jgi:hypothetical protein